MTDLAGSGISVDLPTGWGGEIRSQQAEVLASDGVRAPESVTRSNVVHLANFPLAVDRGEFGDGVVSGMVYGDVFMVLLEYDQTSAGKGLFAHQGIPGPIKVSDFDRNQLQRVIPGQSGVQLFFTEAGRAFCVYIVVGSHFDRIDALAEINHILASLVIDP